MEILVSSFYKDLSLSSAVLGITKIQMLFKDVNFDELPKERSEDEGIQRFKDWALDSSNIEIRGSPAERLRSSSSWASRSTERPLHHNLSLKKEELIKCVKCCQECKAKRELEKVHWTGQQEIFGDSDKKCFAGVVGWKHERTGFKKEQEDSKWKQWEETYLLGSFAIKWGRKIRQSLKRKWSWELSFFFFLVRWETLQHVCMLIEITLLEDIVVGAFLKFFFVCFCFQGNSKQSYQLE